MKLAILSDIAARSVALAILIASPSLAQSEAAPLVTVNDGVAPPPAKPPEPVPPAEPALAPVKADPTTAQTPTLNTDPDFGPPMEAAPSYAPHAGAGSNDEEPGWYVDKSEHVYWDIAAAYGWQNRSYLLTVTPFNFYFSAPQQVMSAHLRVLGMGFLRYRQLQASLDSAVVPSDENTFTLSVFEPTFRVNFLGPLYVSAGFGLRLSFDDGLNAHVDAQPVGLGFSACGWGLEGGLRLMKLPHQIVLINDNEFVYDKYSWQVFARIETNFSLF